MFKTKLDGEEITIDSEYVKFQYGDYYFYNEENMSDIDNPVMIIKQEEIKSIIKVKGGK